jgi:hypothetical protein
LNFLPLPQGQGWLRPVFVIALLLGRQIEIFLIASSETSSARRSYSLVVTCSRCVIQVGR